MADRVPPNPQFIDRFAVIRATIAVATDEDHQVLPGAGIAQETLYPARMVWEDSRAAIGQDGSVGRAHSILGHCARVGREGSARRHPRRRRNPP